MVRPRLMLILDGSTSGEDIYQAGPVDLDWL
jgi:hypothetical protein